MTANTKRRQNTGSTPQENGPAIQVAPTAAGFAIQPSLWVSLPGDPRLG